MDTWPISQKQGTQWTCFGIPERLGDGRVWKAADAWPTLEEIAGEDWTGSILQQLLPVDRTWMWWTRSELYRQAKIPTAKASDRFESQALTKVAARKFHLRGMTASFLPPTAVEARGALLYWAGADTEPIPDHIWAARSPSVTWDVDQIAGWCAHRDRWSDPETLPTDVVGRAVTMFDGQISCAVPTIEVEAAMRALSHLATQWRLRIISGHPEYAWPAAR